MHSHISISDRQKCLIFNSLLIFTSFLVRKHSENLKPGFPLSLYDTSESSCSCMYSSEKATRGQCYVCHSPTSPRYLRLCRGFAVEMPCCDFVFDVKKKNQQVNNITSLLWTINFTHEPKFTKILKQRSMHIFNVF